MKRKIVIGTAVVFLLALCFGVFLGSYRIRLDGATDLVISCPRRARAGQTVSVQTKDVTDGWVEVTVSGAEVTAVQGNLFEFVMPEHAVDVRVRFAWEDLS